MKSRKARIPASAALACLFAALCCAGAYISIPIPVGPVPLALTNLFAVLAGLLLGPLYGAAATIAYVAIGALGFPVFSGGTGGIAHIVGPTGGYLAGYVLASFLAGFAARRRGPVASALGSVLGFAVVLALGVLGLKILNAIAWERALAVGVLPFLIGDSIKAVIAAFLAYKLGPFVDSLTGRDRVRP
jgi:biotin transport system substrate-specific component